MYDTDFKNVSRAYFDPFTRRQRVEIDFSSHNSEFFKDDSDVAVQIAKTYHCTPTQYEKAFQTLAESDRLAYDRSDIPALALVCKKALEEEEGDNMREALWQLEIHKFGPEFKDEEKIKEIKDILWKGYRASILKEATRDIKLWYKDKISD